MSFLLRANIKYYKQSKTFGDLELTVQVMKIAHLPQAVRLLIPDERAAVQCDFIIRFKRNLMAEGRSLVTGKPFDMLQANINNCERRAHH
mgnify:CR=1 FL=1